jgi:DNA-binding MarR family transcriptional regulator
MNNLEDKAYIFGTIFTLSNKLQILGDKLDAQLTLKQWLFLAGVLKCENEAPTLSAISARIGSSRQNVKKMALILEKQGFILMNKDDRDARMLRVSLTDSCIEYLKQREKTELEFIEEVFYGFEPQELSALSSAIKKLEKNVNSKVRNDEEKEA